MAKKTITQRIALDGGKEIEKQLKDLGEVGEKAFDQIRKAALKADLSKFGASLKTFGSDLATVGRRLALAFTGAAAAATAVGAGALKLAKDSAEVVDGMGKAADAAGLTVDAYGRLEFAAKMANVEQTEFQGGMARLNKALGDAAQGSKSALSIFERLGVSIKGSNGKIRPTEAILQDIAEAFSKMPDGAEKSALAIELFGRSGAKLLPLLNSGKQGMIDLGKEAERLGIVFDKNAADIADEMGDALDEVSFAAKGIRFWLGLIFAPAITEGARLLRDVIVDNRDAILQFGKALTVGTVRLIGDMVNALAGNDDKVRNPWILKWRDAIIEFGSNLATVVNGVILPLFRMINEGAKLVADGLNAVFGTKISGGQVLIAVTLLKLLGVFRLFASVVPVIVNGVKLLGSAFAFLAGRGAMGAIATLFRGLVTGALSFLGLIAGLVGWPALIVAGVVAAGVAIYAFWDDITAAASRAWEFLKNLFTAENFAALMEGIRDVGAKVGTFLVDAFKLAMEGIGAVFLGIGQFIAGFVDGVISEIGRLAGELLPSWATIQAAGSAVWEGIKSAATTIWDEVVGVASGVAGRLQPAWDTIKSGATTTWDFIRDQASTLWDGVVSTFDSAKDTVFNAVKGVATAAFEAWTSASSDVVDAANQIVEAINRATEAAGDIAGAEQLAQALVDPFRQAQVQIDQVMASIRSLVEGGFSNLSSIVNSLASQIQSAINRILSALRAAAAEAARLRAAAGSSGGSSGTSQGFASGGHVRGAGGPTTDSILAWLSNGEFVMRAAVVKRLGVDFFHALNNGIIPSLKGLKGFSVGGLVDGIGRSLSIDIPRFASGGFANMQLAPAVSGGGLTGTPVHLHFPDGESFETVAPVRVAAKLSTHATANANLSAGRKPGWYK